MSSQPPDGTFRSEEGLRRGGHTRQHESEWGRVPPGAMGNDPRGAGAHAVIGGHAAAPAKPLAPGANSGSPRGEKGAGATGSVAPAAQRDGPPNTIGRGRAK
jgi:hypothetical protein